MFVTPGSPETPWQAMTSDNKRDMLYKRCKRQREGRAYLVFSALLSKVVFFGKQAYRNNVLIKNTMLSETELI